MAANELEGRGDRPISRLSRLTLGFQRSFYGSLRQRFDQRVTLGVRVQSIVGQFLLEHPIRVEHRRVVVEIDRAASRT